MNHEIVSSMRRRGGAGAGVCPDFLPMQEGDVALVTIGNSNVTNAGRDLPEGANNPGGISAKWPCFVVASKLIFARAETTLF
jgi:hypothetical protein